MATAISVASHVFFAALGSPPIIACPPRVMSPATRYCGPENSSPSKRAASMSNNGARFVVLSAPSAARTSASAPARLGLEGVRRAVGRPAPRRRLRPGLPVARALLRFLRGVHAAPPSRSRHCHRHPALHASARSLCAPMSIVSTLPRARGPLRLRPRAPAPRRTPPRHRALRREAIRAPRRRAARRPPRSPPCDTSRSLRSTTAAREREDRGERVRDPLDEDRDIRPAAGGVEVGHRAPRARRACCACRMTSRRRSVRSMSSVRIFGSRSIWRRTMLLGAPVSRSWSSTAGEPSG